MAARFLVSGGTGNWNSTTNWSGSSGGASGASFPVNGDTVTFDTASANAPMTINVASACTSIAISNYTGTLTFTNNLTVAGSITLGANMVFAGAGILVASETGTLTSNGKTVSVPMNLAPATAPGCTFTLADDWTNTSTVTIGSNNSTSGCVVNGNKFNCTNLTSTAASNRIVSGTTEFVMNATGTLSGIINFQNNLTINTAGTITIGNLQWGGATFKRTAGTVTVTSGTTLTTTASNSTFDLSNVTFYNLAQLGGSNPTYTLTSDLTVSNLYTTNAGAPIWNTSTGKKLFIASLTATTSCNVTGTAAIEFYATGTWSSTGTNAIIQNNVNFNATGGTITISGNIYYNTGTMTYVAGTVTTTGSTLNLGATCTLATNGMSWNNIIVSGISVTLSNPLTALGNVSPSGNVNFNFNGSTFTIGGDINLGAQTSTNVAGTTSWILNGTGTITGQSTTGTFASSLQINTSGTITISGTFNYSTGTFLYTSGTMAGTGNINFKTTSPTVTLNSLFTFAGGITTAIDVTFGGSAGWTLGLFRASAGNNIILTFGNTYTMAANGTLTLVGSAAANIVFKSSSPGNRVIFTVPISVTQDVGYTAATDINSSAAATVWDFAGTLSNDLNWSLLTAQNTIGYVQIR